MFGQLEAALGSNLLLAPFDFFIEEFFDTTFRCCLNTDMHSAELALYFAKLAPQKYTKFYLLNQDYNFGRAAADGFKKKFNKIKAAGPDMVYLGGIYDNNLVLTKKFTFRFAVGTTF